MRHSSKLCEVHMCEQCVADTDMYLIGKEKSILNNKMFLTRAKKDGNKMKKGDWGLVTCNDPDFIFQTTPEPNPYWGMTDDQLDQLPEHELDALTSWETKTEKFGAELLASVLETQHSHYFSNIRKLMDLCKVCEWNPEKITLEQWLFHYLGSFLVAAKPVTNDEQEELEIKV